MKGNVLLSVIVPVYNIEKYLSRCVDSILKQTFLDFELLLIDDGSTDSSGKICDESAQADSRIRVFHKENDGVASARNLGIRMARGKWCVFIDSDDWLKDSNYLGELLEKDNIAELIVSGYSSCNENNVFKDFPITNKPEVFSSDNYQDYLSRSLNRFHFLVIWGKMFSVTILRNNEILFDEKMIVAEDAVFLHSYLSCCDSVCVIPSCGYVFFEKAGVGKYTINAEHAVYHLERTMKGLLKMKARKGIVCTTYQHFISIYFFILYCKYLRKNSFFAKEQIMDIKNVLLNSYIKKELQEHFIIKILYLILPKRWLLVVSYNYCRVLLHYRKYIYRV